MKRRIYRTTYLPYRIYATAVPPSGEKSKDMGQLGVIFYDKYINQEKVFVHFWCLELVKNKPNKEQTGKVASEINITACFIDIQ